MKKITLIILLIFSISFSVRSQVLFSETFSTSLGQCVATNSSNANWIWTNSCTQSTVTGHSVSGHALFSGSSCQYGNSNNTVSGSLDTPSMTINASGAVLTFNYFLQNECTGTSSNCSYDILSMQISTNNGSTYTSLLSNASSGGSVIVNNATWTAVSYTLNSYANQTIKIRFNFNSIDGIGNAYDGVYIDDITVTSNCSINLTNSVNNSTVSPFLCAGNSITLTTNAVSNFTWSNGANTQSIVVSPSSNTAYSVTATSSANCVASSSLNVQINGSVPNLTVANTTSASAGTCPNSSVMLTATGANTYSWISSSGGTVTNGIAFNPTTTATYTLNGTNACGTTSAVTSISIHPAPSVTAVASTASLCSGSTVSLTGIGNASTYTWYGGFGITNGGAYAPTASTNFTVIGTSALSCTTAATVSVMVVQTPSVPATVSPSLICIGKSSTLTATGAANYTWVNGTQTLTTNTLVATPTSPGITTYTIMRANGVCTTTQVATVITNSLPTVFAIVTPTIVCALQQASLVVAGGQTYTWTSPGMPPTIPSFTFSGASPLVFPPVTTIYTVAAHDGTCINTTTVLLSANPNPTVTSTANPPIICSGQTSTVNATGGNNYTITSSVSSATTNTLPVSQVYTTSASYIITGDNSFGCTNSVNQVVVVNANPVVTASVVANKLLVCSGGSVGLNAGGANTYSWSSGALTQSTIVNPVSNVSGPVIYTVTGTFTSTGCHADKTVAVGVFIPTITVTGNTSTCIGGNISLTAGGGTGSNNYRWYTVPGSPATSSLSSLSMTLAAPAVYTITALTTSATAILCPATKTIDVNIFFNPTITAVAQRTPICVKESVVLTAGGGDTYLWNTGGNTQTISVSPNSTTSYTVTGTDINGCVSTGIVLVKVSGCTGIGELNAANIGLSVYPNPTNGEFTIQCASDIKLTLVNDLGQLIRVFELSGTNSYKASVNDLTKGIYFLTGQKDNVLVNQKIVITK